MFDQRPGSTALAGILAALVAGVGCAQGQGRGTDGSRDRGTGGAGGGGGAAGNPGDAPQDPAAEGAADASDKPADVPVDDPRDVPVDDPATETPTLPDKPSFEFPSFELPPPPEPLPEPPPDGPPEVPPDLIDDLPKASAGMCYGTYYATSFEAATDEGWMHYPTSVGVASEDSWMHAAVSGAPMCHSGTKCWTVSPPMAGPYKGCTSSFLLSPPIDSSGCGAGAGDGGADAGADGGADGGAAAATVELLFWQWWQLEPYSVDTTGAGGGPWWDGALVQMTGDDGATWVDVTPSVPYVGVLNPGVGSGCSPAFAPTIVGKMGWSGTYGGDVWWPVTVPIAPALRTSTFRVRFLFGSDPLGDGRGWFVDDVSVQAR